MSWAVQAICDKCAKSSPIRPRRSALAEELYKAGWVKGEKPGKIYCPKCAGGKQ